MDISKLKWYHFSVKNFLETELNIEKINMVVTVPKNTGAPRHRNRAYHGVVLELSGLKKYHFVNGPAISVERGDIIYLPRYSDYDVEVLKPGDCIAINFLVYGEDHFEPFKVRLPNFVSGVNLFKAADSIWNAKNTGYLLKTKALLYEILFLINRSLNRTDSAVKGAAEILKAAKIIENNYYKIPLKISELAINAGMSEVYFRRQFRLLFGISPLKYINNLKIARSMELLSSNQYLIKDIAMMCGYEDEYYFSRDFKKSTGFSPREYLNQRIRRRQP